MIKILYGGGCHGRVCMDIAECNGWRFNLVIDDHAKQDEVHGVRIISRKQLSMEVSDEFEYVLAAGDNGIRQQLALNMKNYPGHPINLLHPFKQYSPRVILGLGLVSMPGVVVNTGVTIGDFCVLNTSCSIDHDCVLGDFVNICPGAHLAGNVRVGMGSFLGTGCIVNPNIKIGTECVIGSGAVVTRDIPDFSVAYGVPARIQKVQR